MAADRPVVAELGRPETPDETAARKAETSRRHRANQTLLNLVVALLGSLLVVVILVAVVVRPTPAPPEGIDYATVAAQAQVDSSEPLLAPVLPPEWSANDARFQTTQQVPTWYIGFLTPGEQYIGLDQGIGANPTWQAALLNNAQESGTVTIEGVSWTIFDQRDASDPGNYAYSLATTRGDSTVLLHGSASDDEFALLATAIAAQWEAE
ncbi:MAG: DUF4245 domain-containing protein [Actinobacteria bacterium]|nr:DUF4245 domain-containing protein [Actinomycetota bacterium]